MTAQKKQPLKQQIDEAFENADEMIWGINTVREMVFHNPGGLSEILIVSGKSGPKFQEIIDQARASQIKLRFVSPERLGVPSSCKHQGVVARQRVVSVFTLDELLEELIRKETNQTPKLLILDSIQDPHNLGAILRSALAAGFDGAIITRERSAPLTGTVARVSAGALALLKVCQVVNLAEAIETLKKKGFWVFGAVVDQEASSLYENDFRVPLCLVIGGEAKGIRPLVMKKCDALVTIPMQSDFDSLNASAAAAVFMFEIVRQQQIVR
jgi:23S rRNA (guanosine2251-2'-O)-methyltransferase